MEVGACGVVLRVFTLQGGGPGEELAVALPGGCRSSFQLFGKPVVAPVVKGLTVVQVVFQALAGDGVVAESPLGRVHHGAHDAIHSGVEEPSNHSTLPFLA